MELAAGVGGCEWYRERTLLGPRGWSEHSRAPTRAPTRRYRLRRRPLCAQVRRPAKALDDMPVGRNLGRAALFWKDGRTDRTGALRAEPGSQNQNTSRISRIFEPGRNLRIAAESWSPTQMGTELLGAPEAKLRRISKSRLTATGHSEPRPRIRITAASSNQSRILESKLNLGARLKSAQNTCVHTTPNLRVEAESEPRGQAKPGDTARLGAATLIIILRVLNAHQSPPFKRSWLDP